MWIKELYIQNFQIIRKAELSFSPDNRVIGIVGRYDDPTCEGRSNRAGKSTFVDAIEYLFYGVGRKRSHVDLINRSALEAGESMVIRGTMVFNDGTEITVTRIRENDGSPMVEVSGREGLKWSAVNEYMEEVIGFTYEENRNTAYFSQGQIHKFMESEPREKRKLLLTWLNQERWDVRCKYSKEEVVKYRQKVTSLNLALNSIPPLEEDQGRLEDLLADAVEEVADLQEQIKTIDEAISVLTVELREAREMVRLEAERKRLNAEAVRLENALEVATGNAKRAAEISEALERTNIDWSIKSETLTAAITKASNQLATQNERVRVARSRLQSIRELGGVCPVLNEGCERVGGDANDKAAGDLAILEAEVVTIEAEVWVAYQAKSSAETVFNQIVEEYGKEREQLGNVNVSFFQGELDLVDSRLDELKGKQLIEVRSEEAIQEDLDQNQLKRSQVMERLGKWRQQIRGYETAIQRAIEYAERRERLEQELTYNQSMTAAWSYCVYMFGNRGIPAEHIKAAFSSLEADVNYILDRLRSGLSIEFRPYRESKEKEKYCLVCGTEFQTRQRKCSGCGEDRQPKVVEQLVLNIHDTMEGHVSDFDLDSGGGKVLISFAVRLALLFLKVRANQGEVPPIILDEVVGMLDPVNRQAIINIVVNILTQEYGVRQIFWISHNEEILDLLENALCVTRFNDHSTVDWL